MTATAHAIVQHGPRDLRPEDLPLPDITTDDAILRIEACGICGSDYEQYEGTLRAPYPVIPGHEPVGVIDQIGDAAAERWDLRPGDRVAVEALLPCGRCPDCIANRPNLCRGDGAPPILGFRPTTLAPGLWGGYATHLYLPPTARMHRMSPDVPAEIAVLFNPIGAGFRWAVDMPHLAPGETIVILGPGQRGLASVIAAREAGASRIIVTGLTRDEPKLDLARRFGATHTIDVEAGGPSGGNPVRVVREITDGAGADVVVDVTAYATEAVTQAIDIARRGGRIVLAGTKGQNPVANFLSDRVVTKELTIYGAIGVDSASYTRAVATIEQRWRDLSPMHTHTLPLDEAPHALDLLAGKIEGEPATHIALLP
jgi:threonine dehydrogenase-like Zn-dependent dehydrogenase